MAKIKLPCYARALGDCDGAINREHYVTEGSLEHIRTPLPGGPRVYQKKKGIRKLQEIGKLYAWILCERHNRLLSPFDAESTTMMQAIEALFEASLSGDLTAGTFTLDGNLLERWMLKTLIGGLYSGDLWPDLPWMQGATPPIEWLEILYRGKPFPARQGLYWQPTEMAGLDTEDRDDFEVLPWFSEDNQTIIGLHVWFFKVHLALLVVNVVPNATLGDYRPAGLCVGNKGIAFNWSCGAQSSEIPLDR